MIASVREPDLKRVLNPLYAACIRGLISWGIKP